MLFVQKNRTFSVALSGGLNETINERMAMFMVAISGFSIGTVNAYEVGVEWTNDYGFWYNDPDEVDFALYSGHGSPTGFYFNNDHDDKKLRGIDTHHDAEWGDLDLEWIALACCKVLKNSDDGEWYERWGYEVFKRSSSDRRI